jgi:alpha-galactosidase
MTFEWDEKAREFHLRNERISYLLAVLENGALGGLYFGPALATGRSYRHLARGAPEGFNNHLGDALRLEYPTAGSGDYRVPALGVELADGSGVLDLRYAGHTIHAGKASIPGLPSTYVESDGEADTLDITLTDAASGLEVELFYTLFRDFAAVARRVRVRNGCEAPVRLTSAMSASIDLPDAVWELVHLSGTWARERDVRTRRIETGRQSISSVRGASGHEHNPFLMLQRPWTTEEQGESIGLSLVYSGNFLAETEVDSYGIARVRLGINPEGFAWRLDPGESFDTPEAVLVYSDRGVGDLSETYHQFYRQRLARGTWRDRERPILINNWEGTYFDFDEAKLVEMATAGHAMGIELFVLDDGWFGERDDETSSLGDWFVDRRKLPSGIDGLASRIEAAGMKFGLWIEPEMVSARSRLFNEHPDWAIGVPGRPRTEGRHQYVLDFSRPEVVDHIFAELYEVLASAPISYVKWDMNRNITEPFSPSLAADRQGEFFHRYILGVYQLYERMIAAFPEILFESCAGGGGRFDPGLLAYAPQGWTSDQTDAVERLRIQWGTSMVYPLSSMGAHVSAVPNHQVGRITPIATRAAVAFFGVFGYELDPTRMSDEERVAVRDQVAFYRTHRQLFQYGRFLRLRSPFEGDGNRTAWMVVSEDGRHAIVGYYRVLNRADRGPDQVRLRGLDSAATFRVSTWPIESSEGQGGGVLRGGDELMHAGLVLDTDRRTGAAEGDFWARLFVLDALDEGRGA